MGKMKRLLKSVACAILVFILSMPMTVSANLSDVSINTDKSNDGTVKYTNRATGASYTEYADGTNSGDINVFNYSHIEPNKQMVRVGKSADFYIYSSYNQTLSNVKVVSGKKNVSAKISYSWIKSNKTVNCSLDDSGRYYYTDPRTQEKIYTTEKKVTVTETVYKIRLTGKKVGNAKISYQFNDLNGNKISKKTMKVQVVNNAKAIKDITFAGKSLWFDMTKNNKYIYASESKNEVGYIKKKSGKIKVKPNKYYRLKGIYVVTASDYITKQYEKETGYTEGTYTERELHAIDINGDGDSNDIIDGIEENASSKWCYRKVKNGAKVKLNNVPDSMTKIHRSINRENNTPDYSYDEDYSENMSTTYFIVIIQDKRTGKYYSESFSVTRRISK